MIEEKELESLKNHIEELRPEIKELVERELARKEPSEAITNLNASNSDENEKDK
jgi:hypothetical protein